MALEDSLRVALRAAETNLKRVNEAHEASTADLRRTIKHLKLALGEGGEEAAPVAIQPVRRRKPRRFASEATKQAVEKMNGSEFTVDDVHAQIPEVPRLSVSQALRSMALRNEIKQVRRGVPGARSRDGMALFAKVAQG